jgi:hypothetical protein
LFVVGQRALGPLPPPNGFGGLVYTPAALVLMTGTPAVLIVTPVLAGFSPA